MATKSEFDYIIVGAGSAGCVVANRLTADGSKSVLLIEAGPRNKSMILSMPAALGLPLQSKKFNWGFVSEPEPGLDGRRSDQHRGKVLGGTSSINGMVFVRGNPLDFEKWAAAGLPTWSYARCLPYFRRMETFGNGADPYRGVNGPLHVRACRAQSPLYQVFLKAGQEYGLPLTADHNGYQQEGVNVAQATIRDGVRESTATAYLRPAAERPNLTVLTGSHVLRVLIAHHRAKGVVYMSAAGESVAHAGREVILSAGVYGSPQLLMLSGVGDAAELERHGIPLQQHSPGVGQNLQDHVSVAIQYTSRKPVSPTHELSRFGRYFTGARWALSRSGLGASNYFEVGAFFRGNSGIEYPNLQHEFFPMIGEFYRGTATVKDGFQYFTSVLRPQSRGFVSLRSANPKDDPRIQLNLLTARSDLDQMVEGIHCTREMIAQRSWDELRGTEVTPGPNHCSDAALEEWIRANAGTNYHAVSTCRMGVDEMAVTDEFGRVHGVEGLRVIDASLMPQLVSGNTNATTIMMAEKLSDTVLGMSLPPLSLPFYRA